MIPPHLASLCVWALSLASILCMLVRPRRVEEAYWVCGGASLLILAGLVPLKAAAGAVLKGWDVYLFLAGMMVLAELARQEGVFDWAAGVAAAHAKGSPRRLFLLVYCVGFVVTAVLSNDATAVVLTPAVLAVVRRARVQPAPYLLACAFIANAASFVLPISNPANLIVFGSRLPPLVDWLKIFLLPSLAAVLVTLGTLVWCCRKSLRGRIEGALTPSPLTPEGRLALLSLLAAAILLVACSTLGLPLGAPTFDTACVAVLVGSQRSGGRTTRVLRSVSWSVIPLVAGLFVIVEALRTAGLAHVGLAGLNRLAASPVWASKQAAAFAVALLSNGMNNLPVGLICGSALRHTDASALIAHAMLIGVDLGPNLSVTGSLATILWLIALRRENVEISAGRFFRVGVVAMPLALFASLLVLWR
ncbi:MAG: arsenic transporter [Terracidiphilus sp.]